MKLEQQCCSLEQGKRLKELGVTAEPLFWYVIDIDPITPLDIIQKWQHSNFDQCEKYPAYTVAELGVMLPPMFRTYHERNKGMWYCKYKGHWTEDFKTEAEARAAMLIYLLGNHLTTPEEVNQRLSN